MGGPLAGRHVLLCVTGGIAAYKAAPLARLLREDGAEVRVAMTASATRFIGADTFAALTGRPAHVEVFEQVEGVLHVRLAREADLAIVAPATANILARLALGLADDLVSSTLLEYRGPLLLAPAMHTGMWSAAPTRANLEALRERGAQVIGPVEGALAAGDRGMGRMAEPEEIAAAARSILGGAGDLTGRRVVVTAGPTHEPIDAVRFLGNRSSGKMGFAVAAAAARRGASVTLVSGPTRLADPPGVAVVRVETAEQMRGAVLAEIEDADALVKAAAVADFRPVARVAGKLKKERGTPELRLEATPDILREIGEREARPLLVGFAAETEDLETAGRRKLADKRLDLVVVNEVGAPGTGFEAETNRAMLLAADGEDEPLRDWTKAELAEAICDRLAKLLS